MIEIRVDELPEKHKRSFYWLAKEKGIGPKSQRISGGRAYSIELEALITYLEANEPTSTERDRAQRIKALLEYEMSLIREALHTIVSYGATKWHDPVSYLHNTQIDRQL